LPERGLGVHWRHRCRRNAPAPLGPLLPLNAYSAPQLDAAQPAPQPAPDPPGEWTEPGAITCLTSQRPFRSFASLMDMAGVSADSAPVLAEPSEFLPPFSGVASLMDIVATSAPPASTEPSVSLPPFNSFHVPPASTEPFDSAGYTQPTPAARGWRDEPTSPIRMVGTATTAVMAGHG